MDVCATNGYKVIWKIKAVKEHRNKAILCGESDILTAPESLLWIAAILSPEKIINAKQLFIS